jgi:hypothetical protein
LLLAGRQFAAVALALLVRVKEAGRRLDYLGSRFIRRERFADILRELGISVVGNMQLYHKLRWAVEPKNPLLLEISKILEFMQRADAEVRLREVGMGDRSLEHLKKLVGYLEQLPADGVSKLLSLKGDES